MSGAAKSRGAAAWIDASIQRLDPGRAGDATFVTSSGAASVGAIFTSLSSQAGVRRCRAVPLVWIFLAAGCCGAGAGGPTSEVPQPDLAAADRRSAELAQCGIGLRGGPELDAKVDGSPVEPADLWSAAEVSGGPSPSSEGLELPGPASDPSSLATRSADAILLSAVPLELVGGLDLGLVELGCVRDQGGTYLRFDAEFSGDRAPLTLLFPVDGGVLFLDDDLAGTTADSERIRRVAIRGYDGASVPFELPPASRLHRVSATYYVFSVVVELEHVDGRKDVLDVGLDWDGWDIDASLLYRRLGPAWMGLFGRETLAAAGPIQARLNRLDDVFGRRLWVGQTERGTAAPADPSP